MSIATQISRLTSIRNSIKAKLVSLGLLQESNGGETPSTKSGTSQSGNVVVGDDLEACKQAINSINETTPYLLSSTGAKNVAGYKYAQVDTTVFEPIGSSGSINPNAQNAYIGASGGISASAPSGSAPVSLGQISPSGNYQGMSAVNLLYDSNVIKAENIRSGVSMFGIQGNLSEGETVHSISFPDVSSDGTTISGYIGTTSISTITRIVIFGHFEVESGENRLVAWSYIDVNQSSFGYLWDDTLIDPTTYISYVKGTGIQDFVTKTGNQIIISCPAPTCYFKTRNNTYTVLYWTNSNS